MTWWTAGATAPQSPGKPTWQPPWWLQPAIETGTALAGAMMSDRQNRRTLKSQELLQKEFAQHGIRWRVEDAKAAGLHPLYALGAQTPSYQPVTYSSSMGSALEAAGQSVGRAIGAVQTRYERSVAELNLRLLEKQLEESDARIGVLRSERARNLFGLLGPGMPEVNNNKDPAVAAVAALEGVPEPAKRYTSKPVDPGLAVGDTPLWRQFTAGVNANGQKVPVVLPGGMTGDPSEVLESLGSDSKIQWIVFMENLKRFGPSWGRWFVQRYAPKGAQFNEWRDVPRRYRKSGSLHIPSYVPYEGY